MSRPDNMDETVLHNDFLVYRRSVSKIGHIVFFLESMNKPRFYYLDPASCFIS